MYFDPAGWLLRHPEMMGRSQYTSGEGCKGLRSTPENRQRHSWTFEAERWFAGRTWAVTHVLVLAIIFT